MCKTVRNPKRDRALRLAALLGLSFVLCGMAGCPKSFRYTVDPMFSVNIINPSRTWPNFDNLTPAMIEALDKEGRPDHFRVWFNPYGELANQRQARTLIKEEELGRKPWSWIYLRKEIEVRFPTSTQYEKVPLSDKLKVLCERGDPQQRPDIQQMKSGSIKESWFYYDVGRKYVFIDEELAEVQIFQGMGPHMKGL